MSSAEVQNEWSCTSISSVRLHVVDNANLTAQRTACLVFGHLDSVFLCFSSLRALEVRKLHRYKAHAVQLMIMKRRVPSATHTCRAVPTVSNLPPPDRLPVIKIRHHSLHRTVTPRRIKLHTHVRNVCGNVTTSLLGNTPHLLAKYTSHKQVPVWDRRSSRILGSAKW
jgi:hypothetical protein